MQVTNFYATSSRYGTPDDFKRLVDEAHGKKIFNRNHHKYWTLRQKKPAAGLYFWLYLSSLKYKDNSYRPMFARVTIDNYFANSAFGCTGLGLLVFMEIVHSYAAADEMVGLSLFDGSNDCYFHSGTFSCC